MTALLERPKVREAHEDLRLEPEVRREPTPEKPKTPAPEAPPPEKVAAPKTGGRWMRWMVAVAVLALAGGAAFYVLRDTGTEVTGTSHPLAEIVVPAPATGTSHPLAEIVVPAPATGTSHPLAEIRVVGVTEATGTSHPLAEIRIPTGLSHPLAELSPSESETG